MAPTTARASHRSTPAGVVHVASPSVPGAPACHLRLLALRHLRRHMRRPQPDRSLSVRRPTHKAGHEPVSGHPRLTASEFCDVVGQALETCPGGHVNPDKRVLAVDRLDIDPHAHTRKGRADRRSQAPRRRLRAAPRTTDFARAVGAQAPIHWKMVAARSPDASTAPYACVGGITLVALAALTVPMVGRGVHPGPVVPGARLRGTTVVYTGCAGGPGDGSLD